MTKKVIGLSTMVVSLLIIVSAAKTARAQDLKEKYRTVNRTVSSDKKYGTIHLNQAKGVGIAWIKGKTFVKGVIEFDVKGKDEFQGSFVGIAFHGLNDTTYEAVYFRPFNFRSTDPVRKAHAVQYITSPKYDWPKLRTDFPNKYEKPVVPEPDPNQWFHVKIVVSEARISVYVNGNNTAALELESLVDTGGKMLGYWVGTGSAGSWKNLKINAK
ncbi:hypothetical protein DBR43_07700 [Pedobacter sp. KBW06]|uniref:hypothetical protein n=1 Tax=Pedobacter sp. KBW06 TaxID=2153359 RepID=UPI000F59B121|nr:hypothetical protein [Pedobacter sp. KBW06]RQO75236.1 hypothetical protein DBR43_07700 [Pedobacter sp. KBW06]